MATRGDPWEDSLNAAAIKLRDWLADPDPNKGTYVYIGFGDPADGIVDDDEPDEQAILDEYAEVNNLDPSRVFLDDNGEPAFLALPVEPEPYCVYCQSDHEECDPADLPRNWKEATYDTREEYERDRWAD